MGPHCTSCYVRRKCRVFMLPALSPAARDEALAPLHAGPDDVVDNDKAVRLLLAIKALEDLVDLGKEWVKHHVHSHGELIAGNKRWGSGPTKGKVSVTIERLKLTGLYDLAVEKGAVKLGDPGEMFTWRNNK